MTREVEIRRDGFQDVPILVGCQRESARLILPEDPVETEKPSKLGFNNGGKSYFLPVRLSNQSGSSGGRPGLHPHLWPASQSSPAPGCPCGNSAPAQRRRPPCRTPLDILTG